jgi:hypothetical protein
MRGMCSWTDVPVPPVTVKPGELLSQLLLSGGNPGGQFSEQRFGEKRIWF